MTATIGLASLTRHIVAKYTVVTMMLNTVRLKAEVVGVAINNNQPRKISRYHTYLGSGRFCKS